MLCRPIDGQFNLYKLAMYKWFCFRKLPSCPWLRWKSHPYATIRTPSLRFRVFTEARPYCSSIARTHVQSSVVFIVTLIGQRENVLVSDSKSKLPAEFISYFNNIQYQLLTERSIHVQNWVFYLYNTSVIMFMIITKTVFWGK